jgi:PAS domain S-box-containing protein
MLINLQPHIPEILRRWEVAIPRDSGASASPESRQRASTFLFGLAGRLAAPEEAQATETHVAGAAACPLSQTLREYHLLRQAIVAVLQEADVLSAHRRQIIDDATDAATEALVRNAALTQNPALSEDQEQYRLLVESARDFGIFTLDREGRVVTWNTGAERITGYPAEEIVGQNGRILFTPEDQARGEAERELEMARTQGRAEDERWHQRKDGSRFFASGVVVPLHDGGWRGYAKVMRDITPRKQLEQELQSRAEALAAADRQKDEFLAMLAHELRNPLAPMRYAVELLKRGGLSGADALRHLNTLERQVNLQARMLEDLLNVSRISRGAISLRPETLDLGALLRGAVEDHRELLEAAGIALTLKVPDQAVWVSADPARLRQVVGNLLQNAGKFTDRGGDVWVRLAAHQERAEVCVRDTGIGIPKDALPHIFKVFTQAERSLERSRGGLGLGLALVKGLVELHGGRVAAHSAGLGHGTEICFTLPLAVTSARTGPEETTTRTGQILSILVVEDNRDAAATLQELLQLQGHRVEVVHSGPEAVAQARTFRPAVILCDIGLPGMDGFRVAEALRSDPATASVCLIAISGYGQDEDQARARASGFDAHMTKPVNMEELEQFLCTAMPR